jgi:hypothetical protein
VDVGDVYDGLRLRTVGEGVRAIALVCLQKLNMLEIIYSEIEGVLQNVNKIEIWAFLVGIEPISSLLTCS